MVVVIKEGPLDLSTVVAGMKQRAMMRTLTTGLVTRSSNTPCSELNG